MRIAALLELVGFGTAVLGLWLLAPWLALVLGGLGLAALANLWAARASRRKGGEA
jgi:hypothetical protein